MSKASSPCRSINRVSPNKNSGAKKRAVKIEECEYFHGLVPRDDVECLLEKPSDFLVRCLETKHAEPTKYILSVATSVEALRTCDRQADVCQYKIRHLTIDFKDKAYSIDQKTYFPDIPEMIAHYQQKNIGLVVRSSEPKVYIKNPSKRVDWELNREWITLREEIGSGNFGVLHKGKLDCPKVKTVAVAVKVLKASENADDRQKIKEMMREARTMRYLMHNNVVVMYGIVVEKEPLMLVLEYVPHGDLKKFLKEHELKGDLKMKIAVQVAMGLSHLHECNFIHRDIAARNVLVGGRPLCLEPKGGQTFDDTSVKICDFGLSREGNVYRIKTDRPLPTRWLAPEVTQDVKFDKKSDVWAFGMLCAEIWSDGDDPYGARRSIELVKLKISKNQGPTTPGMPSEISQLMEKQVWVKLSNRSTMAQVLDGLLVVAGKKEEKKASTPVKKKDKA